MTATVERRAHRRQPALVNQTCLEWWDGSARKKSPAQVVDISPGGALVLVDFPPPLDHRVWLRLVEPAATPWISGRVVRLDDGSVGLSFCEPCPRDFYEAAVQGIGFGNVLGDDRPHRGWPGPPSGPGGAGAARALLAQERDSGTTKGGR